MNEEPKTQHCGDSCGAVAAMAVAFREYVPPEQRMATAISQVLSGEMSQRGAAEANGVARKTLGDHLARLGGSAHPTKPQSSTEASSDPGDPPADPAKRQRPNNRRRDGIRRLAMQNGITAIHGRRVSSMSHGPIYQALIEQGIEVPENLKPGVVPTKKTNSSIEKNGQIKPLKRQEHQSIESTGTWDDDPEQPDITRAEQIRDEVCEEVQRSNRPADFKRAIELLRELDIICTNAWYRNQGEPWNTHDWAHVNSEIAGIYSLVNQRAKEECADYLSALNGQSNERAAALA